MEPILEFRGVGGVPPGGSGAVPAALLGSEILDLQGQWEHRIPPSDLDTQFDLGLVPCPFWAACAHAQQARGALSVTPRAACCLFELDASLSAAGSAPGQTAWGAVEALLDHCGESDGQWRCSAPQGIWSMR